jgi:SNF2 family DNA or RNA helicase
MHMVRGISNSIEMYLDSHSLRYRVIIDEAHALKNRNSLQSKAAAELVARHRLLMTGTPMMNSIDELFPLLRFLRITPYTEWSRFSTDFSKPMKQPHPATRKRAMNRVQVLLRTVMLRRQKTSQVDGQVICTIPDKHTEVDNVEFNDEEHDVYKALETKSQLQFNRYVQNGNISGKENQVPRSCADAC